MNGGHVRQFPQKLSAFVTSKHAHLNMVVEYNMRTLSRILQHFDTERDRLTISAIIHLHKTNIKKKTNAVSCKSVYQIWTIDIYRHSTNLLLLTFVIIALALYRSHCSSYIALCRSCCSRCHCRNRKTTAWGTPVLTLKYSASQRSVRHAAPGESYERLVTRSEDARLAPHERQKTP